MKNHKLIFWMMGVSAISLYIFFTFQFVYWKKGETSNTNLPTIRVLTYSSFAGVYGPGRIIQKKFETVCKCHIQWFLAEDSTALVQRFTLVPEIDVVIGWDQITLLQAHKMQWEDLSKINRLLLEKTSSKSQTTKNKFAKINFHFEESFLQNPYFLPIDWSPVGFIVRDLKFSPSSLKLLHETQGKISFPEPRTSSLGLEFYYWIYEVFEGDKKQIVRFFKKLKNKIYGPVFSWSLAYGFFQKGQTDMGLSYLSSLLYHQKKESDNKYFFANFKEGHPYQVEFLSVSKKSKNKNLSLKLARFLLSKDIQEILQETHYMFPIAKKLVDTTNFKSVNLISYKRRNEFIKQKSELFQLWEENLY